MESAAENWRKKDWKDAGKMYREEIRGTGKQRIAERCIASDADAVKRQLYAKVQGRCTVKKYAVLE